MAEPSSGATWANTAHRMLTGVGDCEKRSADVGLAHFTFLETNEAFYYQYNRSLRDRSCLNGQLGCAPGREYDFRSGREHDLWSCQRNTDSGSHRVPRRAVRGSAYGKSAVDATSTPRA